MTIPVLLSEYTDLTIIEDIFIYLFLSFYPSIVDLKCCVVSGVQQSESVIFIVIYSFSDSFLL